MTTSGSSIVSSLLSGSAGGGGGGGGGLGDVIEAETSISASNRSGNGHRGSDDNGNMLTPFLSGRNDQKERYHKRVHSRHDSSCYSDRYTNFNDVLSVPSNDSHSHNHNHPLLPHQCTHKNTRRYCRRIHDRLVEAVTSNRLVANSCAPCLDRLTSRQRTILARFLSVSTLLTVVVAVPALTYLAAYERHTGFGSMGEFRALFYSAGIFVSLTIPLSVHTIVQHLTNWYMPDVQKFVVRILFMVPIYSVQSWMSLRFHGSSTLIDTVRGLYEAFVIASFVYYLVGLLGGEECMADMLSKKDAKYGKHPAILRVVCGVRDWTMGDEFLLKCKQGALQYVVFKSLSTIAVVVLESTGLYGEGTFGFGSAYLYITALMNASVSWALYCLVKLYYATRDELRRPVDWHAAGKFLCVKGVVFWTFWQGVLIYILHVSGVLDALHLLPANYGRAGESGRGDGTMDSNYMAGCLQDYLVCIEMLLFAVAHRYAFTYGEYVTAARLDAAGDDDDDLFWFDYHNQDDDDDDDLLADVDTDGGGSGRGGAVEHGEDPGVGESLSSLRQATSAGDDATYSTPVIRRLYEPLGAGRAFRAATVPSETVADIRRLGVWGASGARVERVHEVDFRLENAESI